MRVLFLVLVVAASGCVFAPTITDTAAADPGADRAAILEQSRAFSAAYMRGDVDAMVGIYASDGIAAPGGRDFIRGPEALTTFWTLPEGIVVVRHQAVPEELRIDGDLAYDWGYYEGESGPEGEARSFRGKYLIVWQRDSDGMWRIAHDMWNSLPSDEAHLGD